MNQLSNAMTYKSAVRRSLLAGLATLFLASCGGGGGGAFQGDTGTPGAGGGSTGGTTTTPRFLYVANSTSKNITGYTIEVSTGKLTLMPTTPWAAGKTPVSMVVDPSGQNAYVANSDGDDVNTSNGSVSGYSIDRTTGTMQGLLTSVFVPVPAGLNPSAIAIDSTGTYVYVANAGSGDVSGYKRGLAGVLTTLGAPWPTTASTSAPTPMSIAVDPLGRFVYVANFTLDNIAVFSIDTATTGSHVAGALTLVTEVALPTSGSARHPHSVTVDPAGKYVYVVDATEADVLPFTISTSAPWLTPVGNFLTVSTGLFPTAGTISPNGKYFYVANANDDSVSCFSISPTTGDLSNLGVTALPGTPSIGPYSIAVDPSSTYVYMAQSVDNKIGAYKISGSGTLTAVAGAPFGQPIGATGPKSVVVTH
ncbi:MAG: beta-propeller fold lactonase family protein [Pseudomonadota bacterium]